MLVLSRTSGQEIIIGRGTEHETKIVVLKFRDGGVRLGIEAPSHVSVNRGEIQDLIDREASANVEQPTA